MRLRNFVIGTTLISLGLVNANARALLMDDEARRQLETKSSKAAPTSMSMPLPAVIPQLLRDDRILGAAYYDTLKILSNVNSCSNFFGGSTGAIVVLNNLMGTVKREYLEGSVGMRMSGEVMTVTDAPTNTKFRLFKRTSINAKGPFYRKRASMDEAAIPRLGRYEPNTKAVRALILLHELGHLMKGNDGNWLLPDDGRSERLSNDNSARIEDVCGEQIKNLDRANSQ